MFIIDKFIELFFSKKFAHAAIKLVSRLENYYIRFLLVSFLGVLIVSLDMLSALVVGLLVLAIQKIEKLELIGTLDIPNPLIGFDDATASIVAICLIVFLQIIREAALLANELVARRLGIVVGADLKEQVSKVALYTAYDDLSKINKNDIIMYGNNFAAGVGTFAMEFSRLISALIIVSFYALFFLFLEPYAFFFIGIIVLVLIYATNKILLKLEGISSEFRNTELSFFGSLQDSMSGIKDIAVYEARVPFFGKIRANIFKLKQLQWQVTVIQNIITPIQRSSALLIIGAALIALVMLAGNGMETLDPERLVFIMFVLLRIYGPVSQLNTIRSSLLARSAPVISILDFLEMKPSAKIKEELLVSSTRPENDKKLSGDIHLKNAKFTYTKDDAPVLNDVSITFEKGKVTAIVGPSGAGKSTVVDLITMLRKPVAGDLYIGDVKLDESHEQDWRKEVAVIHQMGHIFQGTIAENVSLFDPNYTKEEIILALKRANIWEFVEQSPDGLDTLLGHAETPLSGGQKQRIQIARAFLINPELLILDEATSAQDALSEEALLNTLREDFSEATILVVAHRFSAIKEADKIVVLENGRVVDEGSWQNLVNRPGLFLDLYNAQSLHEKENYA